ncbi:MAG: hypothetical protein M1821_003678 [Bathelium mastoideum]|nr:MAG: hypothetical protein M1821_003678 [Bathelium mastoideum]KAI9690759.1 MAG: hypothetical protein M1822_008378 [Bathelium mastoideum]
MAGKSEGQRHNRSKRQSKGGKAKPKKPPLTHFLCLPLVNESSRPQLQNALTEFAEDEAGVGTIFHEKAIRPLGALHFTIGVMSLLDKDRLDGAIELLQNTNIKDLLARAEQEASQASTSTGLSGTMQVEAHADEPVDLAIEPSKDLGNEERLETASNTERLPRATSKVSGTQTPASGTSWTVEPLSSPPLSSLMRPVSPPTWPRPASNAQKPPARRDFIPGSALNLRILALHPMQSPSKTSVLYAAAEDPSLRLLPFASALRKIFTDAGFLVPDDRPLKLHATIVNTIYAKEGHPRARRRRAQKPAGVSAETAPSNEARSAELAPQHKQHDEAEDSESEERSEDGGAQRGEAKENAAVANNEVSSKPKFEQRFNATELIEKYKNFVWGSNVRLDRLVICEMGAKKLYDANGDFLEEKYTEIASIALP